MECPSCGKTNREGARFCDECGERLESGEAQAPGTPAASASGPPVPVEPDLTPLPDDAPATVGDGRFELIGFLGEGARKRVYLARDGEHDGALTAISVFSTEDMAATAQTRARREAEAMATLGESPHLVGILGSGQDGATPFIASEYMPGGDLEDLLSSSEGRRLEIGQAIRIAADVAAGLEHAHSCGIIHRDIKPANIWLDAAGSCRLGDFGLASTGARTRAAVEGMLVGTVAYLPPEQAIGRRTDARADLYSLGALLYEMLTGEPPFAGDDAVAIISRHLSAEPVPPARHNPAVSAALDALVRRMLAKTPDDRPAGAREVREQLQAIAADPDAAGAGADEDANPLDALAGGVFVGRDRELDELTAGLESALGGHGTAVLIEGEPGIGKTRLAEELATYARVRGARVLPGGCHEGEGAPAYWPFAQAIRAYVRDADPVGLAWQLGSDGPEVARIVPELRERVSSIGEPPPLEGEDARFRFFDGVTSFLLGAAASRPIVLMLDDLHWADSSSLELLRFLGRRISGAALLLLVAYRDEELAGRPELARVVSELEEVPERRRIRLTGLSEAAIARYIELTAGADAPATLPAQVHEQTGGNPFFIGEVVRLMASEGTLEGGAAASAIPRGVREAVERRLARLSPAARDALGTAAVIGRDFDLAVLADVLGGGDPSACLEEAVAARILETGPRPDSYGFAHAVFREALYDGVVGERRRALHRAAGEALERRHADDVGPHLPALAMHFSAAAEDGLAEKAIDYAERAGRSAAAQLAHADAADHLARALELITADGSCEPARELELRFELGEEQTRSGRFGGARVTLDGAAAIARELGDSNAIAAAALGIAALSEAGRVDTRTLALIEEALAAIGPQDSAARSRLLAALAQEQYWADPEGAATDNNREAVEIARRIGDDGALAVALANLQALSVGRPGSVTDRLETAEELLVVAARAGDRDAMVKGHAYKLTGLLQKGDIAGVDRALADYRALAEELREPRHLWHVPIIRATRATMEGNFDEARALSREGARLGAIAEEPLSAQFHAIQMSVLHTLEGTGEEMLPEVRRMADLYPAVAAWRLALVSFLIEADRVDEARVEFEPIAARGLESIPEDATWIVGMSRIGEAAAWLGDLDSSAWIYDRLKGFAGEMVVAGRAAAFNGPIDRVLGVLAAATGRLDEAVAHYDDAIELCQRVGDRPAKADTRLQLGRALLARDQDGDRERAIAVLGQALEDGQEMGMRRLVERAVRVRLEAQGIASVDVNASIDSVASAVAQERPDLGAHAAPDGRVTILFSDIENSTLMTERLGDERWIEVLREHNRVFRRRLSEYGGYEVKNQGDGFMLTFPDPGAGLACAADVQRDLDSREAGEDERIRVRMGLHVGEAIREDGDFFGRTVILAARIAAQARGGEVLVSEDLAGAAGEAFEFDEGRELELKGLAGTHRVFRAEWDGVASVA